MATFAIEIIDKSQDVVMVRIAVGIDVLKQFDFVQRLVEKVFAVLDHLLVSQLGGCEC